MIKQPLLISMSLELLAFLLQIFYTNFINIVALRWPEVAIELQLYCCAGDQR